MRNSETAYDLISVDECAGTSVVTDSITVFRDGEDSWVSSFNHDQPAGDASDSTLNLIARWQSGDGGAATEIYWRYVNQLRSAVGPHLSAIVSSRVDDDDVLQSAYGSFFRAVSEKKFEFETDVDVWKTLLTVSLNKARRRARFHTAAKRDVKQEAASADSSEADLLTHLASQDFPSAEEIASFTELILDLYDKLDERHVTALLMRFEGHTLSEIAEAIETSERSVRRVLETIQELAESNLDSESSR